MRRRLRIATVLLAQTMSACTDDARVANMGAAWLDGCADLVVDDGFSAIDSAGIEIVANTAPAWMSSDALVLSERPSVTIGVRAGDPAYEIGSFAGATVLFDGRVVVADRQANELRLFDSAGRHVRTTGAEGAGPAEFRRIGSLHNVRDTLWVNDTGNRRLARFDGELNLIGSIPLGTVRWTSISHATGRESSGSVIQLLRGILTDGSLLASYRLGVLRPGDVTQVWRDSSILRRFDVRSGAIDSLGLILGGDHFEAIVGEWLVFGDPLITHAASFAAAGDRYYYGLGEQFEIEERGVDGRLLRLIRLCEEPDPVHDTVFDRLTLDRLAGFSEAELVYEEPGLRLLPRPAVAPAYLELIVDRAERLWVRDFTYPQHAQRWRVFAREGRWLGDVDVPADVTVHEIGEDYLLALHTDSMDVPSVRLYRLGAGAMRQ